MSHLWKGVGYMVAGNELNYDTNASAIQMAETIFGDGVDVINASYSGWHGSSAIYSDGDALSPYATPADKGVILSTGRATHFTNQNWFQSNLYSNRSTDTSGEDNNPDFNAIAGTNTYDAAYLDVDFKPTGDVMTMKFVFSSEEYPEFSGSIYSDMVGVWINGTHVPLSISESPTAVGAVNPTSNTNLYVDNTNDQYNTEMDGFTLTMTLTIPVISNVTNSIRIGIADVSDSLYDSNLLIAADSLQTTLVADQDMVTMQEGTSKTVDILANDTNTTGGTLVITHINGQAVSAGQTVNLPSGQSVLLNADGTIDITTGSNFTTSSFTYQVEARDSGGQVLESDTGFVTVETIPCFVAGTMIETDSGPRPVEDLELGDLVMTRDDGLQPVRWVGRRSVAAVGTMAPIQIAANALGEHGTLKVSPLHRVLLRDVRAELMFGEGEVLVAAKHLVNDTTIRPLEGGDVDYVHFMFDRHQVVFSEGLETESFLPGPQTAKSFEQEIVAEICEIFPELDPHTGEGYGPAARPLLKRYEAQTLVKEAG